mmetsp:Transcript_73520/g.198842  ORF Transcript_73520/g.198842 Transcript_73520/m.198842 type:complete len:242 (-) Transcript_73520:867-1592(-)
MRPSPSWSSISKSLSQALRAPPRLSSLPVLCWRASPARPSSRPSWPRPGGGGAGGPGLDLWEAPSGDSGATALDLACLRQRPCAEPASPFRRRQQSSTHERTTTSAAPMPSHVQGSWPGSRAAAGAAEGPLAETARTSRAWRGLAAASPRRTTAPCVVDVSVAQAGGDVSVVVRVAMALVLPCAVSPAARPATRPATPTEPPTTPPMIASRVFASMEMAPCCTSWRSSSAPRVRVTVELVG